MSIRETPEEMFVHWEQEQAGIDRITGRKSTYSFRIERRYEATVRTKDAYDATPDAYDTTTGYGRTPEEAMREASYRAREDDWNN